jgi:hypothetical protein
MTAEQQVTDFETFSKVYDEIAIERSEEIPGYVAIGIPVVEFRKLLWKQYKINRKTFAVKLQKIRDERRPRGSRINLYGSPIYHKDDWVECDGKHWTLIEVETEDHMKRMAPHRGGTYP